MADLQPTKTCTRCRLEKPAGDFGPNRRAPDGLLARCRACEWERQKEHRRKNPEQYKASDRRYKQSDKGRAAARARPDVRDQAERSRKRTEARAAAGVCLGCGKARDSDHHTCTACKERMRVRSQRHTEKRRAARPPKSPPTMTARPETAEYKRQRRAGWRTAGLCIKCGGPRADDGMACCPGCRAKDRDSRERIARGEKTPRVVAAGETPISMAEYKRARQLGIRISGRCTTCGGERDLEDAVRCSDCHAKDRAEYRRIGKARYEKHATAINAETRAKRKAWKAAGKCCWCGGVKEDPKRLRCTFCRRKNRDRLYARRRKWTALGRCGSCGGPRESVHMECEACRVRSRADYKRAAILNPDAARVRWQRRRTRLAGNGGEMNGDEWLAIKEKYDYRCLKCGEQEPEIMLTIDHVVSAYAGGPTEAANTQPLCSSCNQSKGRKCIDYRPPAV